MSALQELEILSANIHEVIENLHTHEVHRTRFEVEGKPFATVSAAEQYARQLTYSLPEETKVYIHDLATRQKYATWRVVTGGDATGYWEAE